MNATLTNLRDALQRRRRGIARALLFACAFAGLALGTMAHAQIAFRSAAQANSAAGATGGGVISFVAAGAQTVTDTAATITPVIPAGTLANDFAVLIVAGRPTDATNPTAPLGWTLRSASPLFDVPLTANDLKILTYYRVLAAGEAGTTVTVNLPASWVGANTAGMSGQIAVWRGVDTTTPFDVADVTGSAAAVRDWTPPAITTVTNGAWAVSAVATSDNNDINVRNANGFTARMSRTNYDTTTGGDHAIALADEAQATAGLVSIIEWREEANSNDPWVGITFALRPSPPTPSTLVINVPAGTVANDVMIASITVRPCTLTVMPCTVTVAAHTDWTPVNNIDQPAGGGTGGNGNRLFVYRRVVTGTEPASYTWTFGGPVHAGAAGGIISFSGVDTTNPIVAPDAGQVTASAYTHAAPSINTGTVTNTMLVSSHTSNSSGTWTPPPVTPPDPVVVMTEAVDAASQVVPNDLGLGLEMNYQLQAAAGATGTRTATQNRAGPGNTNPAPDAGATHMLALRPAASVSHYAISPLSTSVANCDFAEVTVTAHNAAHVAVNPPSSRIVTLSTSVGTGVWQAALVTGAGTWTPSGANNGSATYQWSGTESSFTVRLRQSAVTSLSVNLSDNAAIAETGTEDPTISFANSALRISNGANAALAIGAQIAGKASNVLPGSQNLFLQAIRTDTTTGACTSLFPIGADVAIQVGAQCNNPATCTQNVTLTTNSPAGNSGSFVPNGAFPATINFRFTTANAEAPFRFSYADAGQITLQFRAPQPSPPAGVFVSGTSNAFVVRPFAFYLSGAGMPGVTGPLGTVFKKAGESFDVTVTAVAWQAADDSNNDGVPDSGAVLSDNAALPNFGLETTPETVTVSRTLVEPAGGASGNVTGGSFSGFLGGTKTNAMTWSEVGSITLSAALASGNYLGAGGNAIGSVSPVGRFSPDHFIVTLGTLTNRQALGCSPTPSVFTYEGEPLRVTFMLTARNALAAPTTTTNYATANSFAKLDGAAIANFGFGAVDLADATAPLGATALTPRLTPPGTSSGTWLGGTGNFVADLTVSRVTEDGPFESFRLGILPVDTDGITLRAADLDLDTTVPADSNDRALVGSSKIRFGRLQLGNANGSQLLPLALPMVTQYWNGTVFVTNVDDNCTAVANGDVGLGNYAGLVSGDTTASVSGAFIAGRKTLMLSAPVGNKSGSVDVVVNLNTTLGVINPCVAFGAPVPTPSGANLAHLRSMWCGAGFDRDPVARARFGVTRGSEEVIFIRENF